MVYDYQTRLAGDLTYLSPYTRTDVEPFTIIQFGYSSFSFFL